MPVRPAKYADLDRCARILADAFKDGAIQGEYLRPYRHEHPEGMYYSFLRMLRLWWAKGAPDDYPILSYDVDGNGEETVITGIVYWHRWRGTPVSSSWIRWISERTMLAANYVNELIWPDRAAEPSRMNSLNQLMPFIGHHWSGRRAEVWDLGIIGVDPTRGKKGHGRELVQWGMRKAAEDAVPCCVIAGLGVIGFYRKLGFDDEVGNVIDEGGDANPVRAGGCPGAMIMFCDHPGEALGDGKG
jgi:GNAT superfamily N-acetyltransferase